MPQSLTLSRYDINTYERSYSPVKYLSKARWDDQLYFFLKTCAVCFMVGIAPVQRPVRHKDIVRVEIIRRKEELTPGMERRLFRYKLDSLTRTPSHRLKMARRALQHRKTLTAMKEYNLTYDY